MTTYYIYHNGTGTLLAAEDGVFIVSDELLNQEQMDDMDNGDTSPLDYLLELGALKHGFDTGVEMMKVIAVYDEATKDK